jgi:hypothetical protein
MQYRSRWLAIKAHDCRAIPIAEKPVGAAKGVPSMSNGFHGTGW